MSRVLIVDDEPDILLMLRVNLEADGFETALAADGDTALRRIGDERFDVVLLDVMMPVMDGWAVLEALKRAPAPPPVLVLSAKSGERDVARALELGAVDYLKKPVVLDSLTDLLNRVVGWSPAERDAHRKRRLQKAAGVGA